MDIKLMPVGSPGEVFTFPALPEKVRGNTSTKYRTFTVISKGDIQIPRGIKTNEYQWDGEFFGRSKRNESIVKREHWKEPVECVGILRRWMDDGTTLNLIITDTWINADVTISEFTPVAYGGYGNIQYGITLSVYKNMQMYTTEDLGGTGSGGFDPQKIHVGGRTPHLELSGKKYTIAEDDTLWKIAIYVYGDGSLWESIWKKNKTVLDKEAKKHKLRNSSNGEILFPGTVISIP